MEEQTDLMEILAELDESASSTEITHKFYDTLHAAGYTEDEIMEESIKFYELLRIVDYPADIIEDVAVELIDLLH
jgi:hypothetical protein